MGLDLSESDLALAETKCNELKYRQGKNLIVMSVTQSATPGRRSAECNRSMEEMIHKYEQK